MVYALYLMRIVFGSVVQTFLDEAVAPWKPFEKILILYIIHWNVKMLITTYKWNVVFKLPIEHRNDVRNVAVLERLLSSKANEPERVVSQRLPSSTRCCGNTDLSGLSIDHHNVPSYVEIKAGTFVECGLHLFWRLDNKW